MSESLWFQCGACRHSARVNIPHRELCKAGELLDVTCPKCSKTTSLKDSRVRTGVVAWDAARAALRRGN